MAGEGKEKRTGADEAGKRRRRGRPPGPPLSEEEKKKKKKEKNIKDKEYRAKKTFERTEFEAFCEMPGINDMFKAFSEEYRKRNEECSKNGGTNEFLGVDNFHDFSDLEMWIGYLAVLEQVDHLLFAETIVGTRKAVKEDCVQQLFGGLRRRVRLLVSGRARVCRRWSPKKSGDRRLKTVYHCRSLPRTHCLFRGEKFE